MIAIFTENFFCKRQYYEKIKPENGIIRSQVLPGFQFREKDLYLRPEPEELFKDDVYKSFVKVDYQKQHKKTELERKAKEEAIRAKKEAIKAKEQAIKALEQEKQAKIGAFAELERLKKLQNMQNFGI